MERGGQGAGGAGQVVCQGRQGEPRGIGLEMTGRRVGEAAVLDIGDHLLDDSVPTVITLGIPQGECGVGERGVMAPGVEECALPGGAVPVWAGQKRTSRRRWPMLRPPSRRNSRSTHV
jgi:hypothetical protein